MLMVGFSLATGDHSYIVWRQIGPVGAKHTPCTQRDSVLAETSRKYPFITCWWLLGKSVILLIFRLQVSPVYEHWDPFEHLIIYCTCTRDQNVSTMFEYAWDLSIDYGNETQRLFSNWGLTLAWAYSSILEQCTFCIVFLPWNGAHNWALTPSD